MFKKLLLLCLLVIPSLWATNYTTKGTVTFPGAVTSTQTNIPLLFTFSDIKFAYKTTTGGQIQNLCSRNGGTNNVPCDFIFTDDGTCSGLGTTPYKWGFDGDYSSTLGTGHGWLLVPSYTTSSTLIYVCINNSSIAGYQGGAAGVEFTTSPTALTVQHLADGNILSLVDYSGNPCNGVSSGVTVTTGKIDGGGSFNSTGNNKLGGTTCGSAGGGLNGVLDAATFTYEAWINPTTTSAYSDIYNAGANAMPQFSINPTGGLFLGNAGLGAVANSSNSILSINIWSHVSVTWNNSTGAYAFYLNGADVGHGTVTIPSQWSLFNFSFVVHTWTQGYFNSAPSMKMDELRVYGSVLPISRILNDYTNQNNPPAISALAPVSSGGGFPVIY